jgi:fatty-acyl-CoA synthase
MPDKDPLSFEDGGRVAELSTQTVGALFDATVARCPNGSALVVRHQGVRWTWWQLSQRVDACAAGLLALGLVPGDRVGVLAPNVAEWVVTQLATAKAGLILVNINPANRLRENEHALATVGVRALVTASRFKHSDYLEMIAQLRGKLPLLEHVIVLDDAEAAARGLLSWRELLKLCGGAQLRQLERLAYEAWCDDAINIQFTSGTTGLPKAATLSHKNIVNNAIFTAANMRLGPEDKLCIPVPMYHCFGMVLGSLACVATGATIVFPSAGFDASETLHTVAEERCTALHGVPTMFIAELEDPLLGELDVSCLRTGIMAGAPCPIELMKRVQAELCLNDITIAYGQTETGPVSTQTQVDDTLARRVQTVGRALPHTQVKIVDDNGQLVPRGERGELCTRGYCVMKGYWGDEAKTHEAIDESGWMHSGDLATVDDDGYFRIVGRLKHMIIRGGENIYPREIEEHLYTHPDVESVEVFGVPSDRYGEEVAAWVKCKPSATATAEDLRAFCDGQIAHFKIPRFIELVDEFPMTVTGKVQKFVMRAEMAKRLGLKEAA